MKNERLLAISRKTAPKLSFLLKLCIGLLVISPLLLGFLFSFLPNEMLNNVPKLSQIVNSMSVNNYKTVLTRFPIFRYLFNTLVVCLISIIAQVTFACLAGYAFAMFKFKGRNFIFTMILVAMMIPAEVTVIANFLQIQSWGLINTYLGLSITSLVGGTGIFLMRQYFLQLPKEIKEASVVDGCGEWRFLLTIAVPMAIPIIASLSINIFISSYNRYFWPMLVAQKQQMQTIQIGMAMLVGVEVQEYGNILAGAMVSIIIPVLVFIFGMDYIIKGMTAGAVKG